MKCRFCPTRGKHFENKVCSHCATQGLTKMGQTHRTEKRYFSDRAMAYEFVGMLREANILVIGDVHQGMELFSIPLGKGRVHKFKMPTHRVKYLIYAEQEPAVADINNRMKRMIKRYEDDQKKRAKKVAVPQLQEAAA